MGAHGVRFHLRSKLLAMVAVVLIAFDTVTGATH